MQCQREAYVQSGEKTGEALCRKQVNLATASLCQPKTVVYFVQMQCECLATGLKRTPQNGMTSCSMGFHRTVIYLTIRLKLLKLTDRLR